SRVIGSAGSDEKVKWLVEPTLTDHSADFLSRVEAFDRAADTVEAWNAEYGPAPAPAAATR
ncbi:hypothetical protein ABZ054_11045, partial [Streptomyces sp. NPDC006324]